jgi:hypothetical protein
MAKRIIRIFPEAFSEAIEKEIGEKATVILKDGLSFRGTLLKIEADRLLLELKANRKPYFNLIQIQEIQIDKITEW